jgi:hypothetical protein
LSVFNQLPKLGNSVQLNLANNLFASEQIWDDAIGVTNLNVSNGKIETFVDNTRQISSLNLSHNYISNPIAVLESEGLEELNLSHNSVEMFSAFLVAPKLRKIDISNNKITSVETKSGFENLKEINFANNPISVFQFESKSLEVLNLDKSNTQVLDLTAFPKLRELSMVESTSQVLAVSESQPFLEKIDARKSALVSLSFFSFYPNLKQVKLFGVPTKESCPKKLVCNYLPF